MYKPTNKGKHPELIYIVIRINLNLIIALAIYSFLFGNRNGDFVLMERNL